MQGLDLLQYMQSKQHINKIAVTTADSYNDYYHDKLPTIPAGVKVLLRHGGDFGLYGIADIDGVLYNVKFRLDEVQNIDWDNLQ